MTIKGSMFSPSEAMSEKDTMEAIRDGLLKASSAAREMAVSCEDKAWADIARTLDAFRHGIKQLADMRSMSRFETMVATSMKQNPQGFLN